MNYIRWICVFERWIAQLASRWLKYLACNTKKSFDFIFPWPVSRECEFPQLSFSDSNYPRCLSCVLDSTVRDTWVGYLWYKVLYAVLFTWRYTKTHHNTTQHTTTQHNTTQHNTTQHNTTQHNTAQHNTTQHNTTQHNTTQHNTKQNNTTQHNTTQHNVPTVSLNSPNDPRNEFIEYKSPRNINYTIF